MLLLKLRNLQFLILVLSQVQELVGLLLGHLCLILLIVVSSLFLFNYLLYLFYDLFIEIFFNIFDTVLTDWFIGENGRCVFATPPTILACELKIPPGSSKVCMYFYIYVIL